MKPITPSDYKLIQMWNAGVSLGKIAQHFSRCKSDILKWLGELECAIRDQNTVKNHAWEELVCKECGKDYFSRRFKKATGYCRPCQEKLRESNPNKSRLKPYKLTKEEYTTLLNRQNGKCAICHKPETSLNKSLAVDHCHKTGQVRSLLCGKCNRGLGLFNDSSELLERASSYLNNHAARSLNSNLVK